MNDLSLTAEQQVSFNELLPLVSAIATKLLRKRTYQQADLEDAIQDGSIALCAAIRDYDPEINDSLGKHCAYRIWRRLMDSYRSRFGRGKSNRRKVLVGALSLSETIRGNFSGNSDTVALADTIADPKGESLSAAVDNRDELDHLMRVLTQQQAESLALYFCSGYLMREVADIIDLSESRAYQIIDNSLRHLRITHRREHGVGVRTPAPQQHRRARKPWAIVGDDGSLMSPKQYADANGITRSRAYGLAAAGKLRTIPIHKGSRHGDCTGSGERVGAAGDCGVLAAA